ncbi:LHFPL tetraspan subfamily member 2 protein, partial [Eurytemora carolleeae]
MCTIIVTIRSVLWAVMTIVGTLMILVALFTNRWLQGRETGRITSVGQAMDSFMNIANNVENVIKDGEGGLGSVLDKNIGIFLDCKEIAGQQVFAGECIPDLDKLFSDKGLFSENDQDYPHAWKAGIGCFIIGLGIMVLTVMLSLLTPCCRSCLCCSVFTVCGSFQSFAAILFTLGLLSFPAGWGSERVVQACGNSEPFIIGHCQIGGAFWMAV